MKRMKIAISITLVVTVAYAIMLTILGHANLPVEKTLVVFSHNWLEIQLPFVVSPWWNLFLCPLIILFIGYGYSKDAIIGKEPEHRENIERKYHVRMMLYFMNLISATMVLGTMLLSAIMWIIVGGTGLSALGIGPLSMLATAPIIWLGCYILIGVWEEFAMTLGWNTVIDTNEDDSFDPLFNPEESLMIKFKATLTSYVKAGIIKSFPLLFGMVLAFMIRFSSLQVMKLIRKIKKTRIKIQTV